MASAVDEGYLPFALVVATSIARHARSARPVEYHVLYDGPDHWAVGRLKRFHRGNVRVFLHRLANPWRHIGAINGFPPSALFRIAIPDVLAEYSRAIYLDCDLVATADLADLFDADLAGRPMGATRCVLTVCAALIGGNTFSGGRWVPTTAYFRDELGLATREQQLDYIQSGVQLMDLDRLRAMDYARHMAAIAEAMRDRLAFADQCATNKLLAGQVARIDPRWNVSPFALDPRNESRLPAELQAIVRQQRASPGIIHFGGEKPWHRPSICGGRTWWYNAAIAGVAHKLLRRTARLWLNSGFEHVAARFPRAYKLARRAFRAIRPLPPDRR